MGNHGFDENGRKHLHQVVELAGNHLRAARERDGPRERPHLKASIATLRIASPLRMLCGRIRRGPDKQI